MCKKFFETVNETINVIKDKPYTMAEIKEIFGSHMFRFIGRYSMEIHINGILWRFVLDYEDDWKQKFWYPNEHLVSKDVFEKIRQEIKVDCNEQKFGCEDIWKELLSRYDNEVVDNFTPDEMDGVLIKIPSIDALYSVRFVRRNDMLVFDEVLDLS